MKLIWKHEWRFEDKSISERKEHGTFSLKFSSYFLIFCPLKTFEFHFYFYTSYLNCMGLLKNFTFFTYYGTDVLSLCILKMLRFSFSLNVSLSSEQAAKNMILNINSRMYKLCESGQEILSLVQSSVNNEKSEAYILKSTDHWLTEGPEKTEHLLLGCTDRAKEEK